MSITEEARPGSPHKKAYQSPVLRNYGRIDQKTFTGTGGTVADGAGGTYTS